MKKGFTLVEVLITLGIIGVVAVLTLPNMIKNHQRRVLVTQLQRTYNAIENNMLTYMDSYDADKLYDTDAFNMTRTGENTDAMVSFIKKYFKTLKICTKDTNGGLEACKSDAYRRMNNDEFNNFKGEVCTILSTEATICFERMQDVNKFPYVYIDVNGKKGPNVWGRDAFELEFNNASNLAESFMIDVQPNHDSNLCETNPYGGGCFNRIIKNGWVMDY